jgi:hypothetical protein
MPQPTIRPTKTAIALEWIALALLVVGVIISFQSTLYSDGHLIPTGLLVVACGCLVSAAGSFMSNQMPLYKIIIYSMKSSHKDV